MDEFESSQRPFLTTKTVYTRKECRFQGLKSSKAMDSLSLPAWPFVSSARGSGTSPPKGTTSATSTKWGIAGLSHAMVVHAKRSGTICTALEMASQSMACFAMQAETWPEACVL